MKNLRTIGMVFAVLLFAGAGAARAEVQKFIVKCGDKLCPYFHIALTPPPGWVLDARATWHNKVQIIVPQGTTFDNAPALIYVQVFYHRDKKQSLADFARVSNARWRAEVKDAKITALPAVKRANGKPGFLRFAFENPSKKQQAYELGAFGIDSDKDGNEFVLDVVMTGADKAALDRVEKDYVAFLKAH
jgi:hypothetical protein